MLLHTLQVVLIVVTVATLTHSSVGPYRQCTNRRVYAKCALWPDPRAPFKVTGAITLSQADHCGQLYSPLKVSLRLRGYPAQRRRRLRAIAIYTYGDLTRGCLSIGQRFNPYNMIHGGPKSPVRRVGDLGNFPVRRNGKVIFYINDSVASLFGNNSIIGRSIAVHAKKDDLGLGGNPESLKTGNAGARLACCVIGRARTPRRPRPHKRPKRPAGRY